MRAIVLAAGRGDRLRPLTDSIPKPMVPINGRPLLEHTVEWLHGHGFDELVITLHHHPEVIQSHFGDGSRFGVCIRYSYEPELLGTSGALLPCRSLLEDGTFLIMYGDNLTNCDLRRPLRLHREKGAILTMAAFYREDVTKSGMACMEPDGRVTCFREKPSPDEVTSHWVSAGVLFAEPRIYDYIPTSGFSDFGRDIFPALLTHHEPLYADPMPEKVRWADTLKDYQELEALARVGQLL